MFHPLFLSPHPLLFPLRSPLLVLYPWLYNPHSSLFTLHSSLFMNESSLFTLYPLRISLHYLFVILKSSIFSSQSSIVNLHFFQPWLFSLRASVLIRSLVSTLTITLHSSRSSRSLFTLLYPITSFPPPSSLHLSLHTLHSSRFTRIGSLFLHSSPVVTSTL